MANGTRWTNPGTGSTVAELQGAVIASMALDLGFQSGKVALRRLQYMASTKGQGYRTDLEIVAPILSDYDMRRCESVT